MLTKSHSKLIQSLKQKKFRKLHNLFVVEGVKSINEVLISRIKIHTLFYTEEFTGDFDGEFKKIKISTSELSKVSNLKTASGVLALCEVPISSLKSFDDELILVLDGVNDPGNLGTIIRLADWFGVKNIICSKETVDCYNSKVIQSTMGSFTRVKVIYTDLDVFLANYNNPIYGTFIDGNSIYKETLPAKGAIVMGNEANGISSEVAKIITRRITIPQFGQKNTESLNVAMATSIVLNEFKRF